jgi:hypothetical protein
MSIPICGVNRMMPMRSMHGMGFMHCMQKPDASEIANQMINNRDKDGDGALNTDELGRLSDRMGLVEADFNEDGLIDQEKLISKISEKLEKMEGLPKIRGLKIYRICMNEQMAAEIGNESTGVISETESSSETDPNGVISETQSSFTTDPTGVISETESSSETDPTGVISETQSSFATDPTGVISETQSISDLVKQLLSRLDLSNEEIESFLETMKNYGINVTA